jgi:hypothetical protein
MTMSSLGYTYRCSTANGVSLQAWCPIYTVLGITTQSLKTCSSLSLSLSVSLSLSLSLSVSLALSHHEPYITIKDHQKAYQAGHAQLAKHSKTTTPQNCISKLAACWGKGKAHVWEGLSQVGASYGKNPKIKGINKS